MNIVAFAMSFGLSLDGSCALTICRLFGHPENPSVRSWPVPCYLLPPNFDRPKVMGSGPSQGVRGFFRWFHTRMAT
eukprot:scaffold44_cov339-Pavlova_lutheri.AAC.55